MDARVNMKAALSRAYISCIFLFIALAFIPCINAAGDELYDAQTVTWDVSIEGSIPISIYDADSAETTLYLPDTPYQERVTVGDADTPYLTEVRQDESTVTLVWEDIRDAEELTFSIDARFRRHLLPLEDEKLTADRMKGYRERVAGAEPRIVTKAAGLMGPSDMETIKNHLTYFHDNHHDMDEHIRHIHLAAMLRDVGIPARFVYGIHEDSTGTMNPHLWIEAYLKGYGWHPIDMTDRQVGRLDTTHIALRKSPDPVLEMGQTSMTGNRSDDGGMDIQSDFSFTAEWSDIGRQAPKTVMTDVTTFVDTMAPSSHNIIEITLHNEEVMPQITFISLMSPSSHITVQSPDRYILVRPESQRNALFKITNTLTKDMLDGDRSFSVTDSHARHALSRHSINHSIFSSVEKGVNLSEKMVERLVTEGIHIIKDKELGDGELDLIFSNMSEEEREAAKLRYRETRQMTSQTKYSMFNSSTNTTTIKTTLFAHRNLSNVSIYERIPKCLAREVSKVSSDRRFDVIQADPLIVWQIEEITERAAIRYDVIETLYRTNCSDRALTAAVAEEIAGIGEQEQKSMFNPIVAGTIALIVVMMLLGLRMAASRRENRYQ